MERRDAGFTLIEILVSLAILGLVLPVVLYAFTNSSRTRASSAARTTAAYLVRDRMAEIEAVGDLQTGDQQGEFAVESQVRWATSISETETEGLYDVVVRVIWQERGQDQEFAIRTYLADPTIAQTGTGAPSGGR